MVSELSFGTMLFGESTDERTAFALLGQAADAGVTLFDSAEMYPVPQRAATAGESERILGRWLRMQQRRDAFAIATKVAGPSGQMDWLRGGPAALDAPNIAAALDGSLSRLGVDYVDLYLLHWPDRYVPMFGDVDYDPQNSYSAVPLEEQLCALGKAVAQGKVRYVGLSNETPWGVMECTRLAKKLGLPQVVALQNSYSLLCRTFDAGLAECCHREGIGLIAYSPMAMGLLTGKYLAPGGGPADARLNRYRGRYAEAESRYGPRPNSRSAVTAYAQLATASGMSLTELALRFVLGRPLVTSALVGARDAKQLAELLAAAGAGALPTDVARAVDELHARYPNPNP